MYVKHKKVRYSKCWKKDCNSLLLKIIRLVSLHWGKLSGSDSLSKAVMFSLHWKSGPSPAGILRRFFLGASEKKDSSFSSMYVHVTVTCLISSWSKSHDHGYHLHHFPASPNWLAYTAAAMASSPEGASRLMPWHMQHATTFHITIGKIHKKKHPTSQFQKAFCSSPSIMFLSMSSAKAENYWLPWGQVRGGPAIISTSSCMFWEANCIKNYLKYIYHIQCAYLYHICYFSYQNLRISSSSSIPHPHPLPTKCTSLRRFPKAIVSHLGFFFHHKKRGLGIPTSGFFMLKSLAHTMVFLWKLYMRSITLHMMIGDRKIIYQVLGSWSCIPNNFHLWPDEAFESFCTIPLKSPTSKRILRYLKRFASA